MQAVRDGAHPPLALAVMVCPFLYRFAASNLIVLPQKQAVKYARSMAPALLNHCLEVILWKENWKVSGCSLSPKPRKCSMSLRVPCSD
jgi:hypothetical protein